MTADRALRRVWHSHRARRPVGCHFWTMIDFQGWLRRRRSTPSQWDAMGLPTAY